MPPPIKVELARHDPQWSHAAAVEADRLHQMLGPVLIEVHHIGSTAIPGIVAKPILDLLPVVADLGALDRNRRHMEALGYEWWGEMGLSGRRYFCRNDAITRRRLVQLHCYQVGSSEIERHLAFRDYLRAHGEIATAYEWEKLRCRDLHPENSHEYADCKGPWIALVEQDALRWYRAPMRRT